MFIDYVFQENNSFQKINKKQKPQITKLYDKAAFYFHDKMIFKNFSFCFFPHKHKHVYQEGESPFIIKTQMNHFLPLTGVRTNSDYMQFIKKQSSFKFNDSLYKYAFTSTPFLTYDFNKCHCLVKSLQIASFYTRSMYFTFLIPFLIGSKVVSQFEQENDVKRLARS